MGLISHLISFGTGVYAGLYYSQNYENVPKVPDPPTLIEMVKDYLEKLSNNSKK